MIAVFVGHRGVGVTRVRFAVLDQKVWILDPFVLHVI